MKYEDECDDYDAMFGKPDDVSIWHYFGRLILCVMLAPIILLSVILIPMFASQITTTYEMKTGIVLLGLFTLVFGVLCLILSRR